MLAVAEPASSGHPLARLCVSRNSLAPVSFHRRTVSPILSASRPGPLIYYPISPTQLEDLGQQGAELLELPEPPSTYLLCIRGRAEFWPLTESVSLADCDLLRCNSLLGTRAHGATEHERAEVGTDEDTIYCSFVHERYVSPRRAAERRAPG